MAENHINIADMPSVRENLRAMMIAIGAECYEETGDKELVFKIVQLFRYMLRPEYQALFDDITRQDNLGGNN